ncbi:winged helix-turn-helix transcriptional regulator [Enterococcus sp. BWR-S5]|uniref:winged helix-turn-helix transcriptional regulator n=1 Tax=Enterococcus sp. BWR-S5 TaxID=2787714 RepID=UPI001924287B|nr:helix-turn-helix domain-containing protein [Enterococcus sp. BWR-S5]MBL1225460.1 helix-turn-helix transcriptional regulator [Enterococcus sp. BWR-S5]
MKQMDWEDTCPLVTTQRIMAGKWKLSILWFLAEHPVMRFNELKAAFEDPTLTQKMLTQHLKELQEDQLVTRTVYNTVPPKVEYRLSALGKSFIPVMRAMEAWGETYQEQVDK